MEILGCLDDKRRFGFHTLRHGLASFLVRTRTDPKTVQTLLRHSNVAPSTKMAGGFVENKHVINTKAEKRMVGTRRLELLTSTVSR